MTFSWGHSGRVVCRPGLGSVENTSIWSKAGKETLPTVGGQLASLQTGTMGGRHINTDQTQQQLTGVRWVPVADKGLLSPGLSLVSLFCEQYCLSCLSIYAWQADQTSWGGCLCVVCDIIYKSVTIIVITVTEDRC